jgi:hypothetical protein
MLSVILLSTTKDFWGIYTVTVLVDGKEYKYDMKSYYDVEQFIKLLPFHPGKALNYLKDNCIKGV